MYDVITMSITTQSFLVNVAFKYVCVVGLVGGLDS